MMIDYKSDNSVPEVLRNHNFLMGEGSGSHAGQIGCHIVARAIHTLVIYVTRAVGAIQAVLPFQTEVGVVGGAADAVNTIVVGGRAHAIFSAIQCILVIQRFPHA